MTLLQIRLLGGFQLQYGEELLQGVFQTRQQSLLAYLLLHQQLPQTRQQLAFRFWPDATESRARAYLRREIFLLRKGLPNADTFLNLDNKAIQWRADAPFTLDVAQVETLLTEARAGMAAGQVAVGQVAVGQVTVGQEQFTQLIKLYQGHLLPDCYDEWIFPLRAQLQERLCATLDNFVQQFEAARAYALALQVAQQLLHCDPLREPTYHHLMRLYALMHDRTSALRIFRDCSTMLEQEFAAPPSIETQSLYDQLFQQNGEVVLPSQGAQVTDAVPLIGRLAEWQRLLTCWRELPRKGVHVAVIRGEAGIGKTRLAEELLAWAQAQQILTAQARAYAAEGALPYGPLIELLRTERLQARLTQLESVWRIQLAHLLPELVTQDPDLLLPETGNEQWQRHHLFEAAARTLLIGNQPLLILLDDLQWVDQETLEWLHFLVRYVTERRVDHPHRGSILIVSTLGDEELTPGHPINSLLLALRRTDYLTELALPPLTDEESTTLAQQITGKPLSLVEGTQLFQYTEGNPLFIVEHLRSSFAQRDFFQSDQAQTTVLPPKVQAVIEARLAQLSPQARGLAGLAAVIGREFSYQLLVTAGSGDERQIVSALDELCRRRIVRGAAVDRYDFTHDKLREVAYDLMGMELQRLLHRRVAEGLEQIYRHDLKGISGQLAAHFALAGNHRHAFDYYLRAGQAAREVYAIHQVIHYLERGVQQLQTLAQSTAVAKEELTTKELQIQVALGAAQLSAEGYASTAAERAYLRALALGTQLRDQTHLFTTYWGLHEIYLFRAQHAEAHAMSTACMEIAQALQEPDLLLQAHHALFAIYMMGDSCDLARTVEHTNAAIALYEPTRHHDHTFHYGGHDPCICARQLGAKALWLLGYPDQALHSCAEGLALTAALFSVDQYPLNIVFAQRNFAEVYMLCGQVAKVVELTTAMSAVVKNYDLAMYSAQCLIFHGWALAQQQQPEAGIAQMRQGVAQWVEMGIVMEQPNFMRMLAEGYLVAGQLETALAVLAEALAAAQRGGGRFYEAEIHRLRGNILQAQGADHADVEACYQEAVAVATALQAKSLELRAVMDLSQLWFQQGKQEEARTRLADCYNWFTEGFGTADLQAAQALLQRFS